MFRVVDELVKQFSGLLLMPYIEVDADFQQTVLDRDSTFMQWISQKLWISIFRQVDFTCYWTNSELQFYATMTFSRFDRKQACDRHTDRHKATADTALAQCRVVKYMSSGLWYNVDLRILRIKPWFHVKIKLF